MQLVKEGFPEENELVMCTITKIHFHSVFVNVDEYKRSGMIHISEISPGRIRNIRDYVTEGKVVVCKVLRIDKEKGHIDLSLRRVTDAQRRAKVDEIKQEQKAEKIIEFVARQLKLDNKQFYEKVSDKIFEKYDSLSECFEEVALKDLDLTKLGIDKKQSDSLTEAIKQRIKPPEVQIKSTFTLKSYAPEGIETIKSAVKTAQKKGNEKTQIKYLGGGRFNVIIKGLDYKECEKVLEEMTEATTKFMQKNDGEFTAERDN